MQRSVPLATECLLTPRARSPRPMHRSTADLPRREALAVLATMALAACGSPWRLAGERRRGGTGRTGIRATRIYTGDDGRSHFEEVTLPKHDIRAGVTETDWFDATRVSLRFLDSAGVFVDQPRHVAPPRQVAVITNGALEVECAEGATRRFGAGAVVLLEDGSFVGRGALDCPKLVCYFTALFKMQRSRQLDLRIRTWGGRRPGSGRPPAAGRRKVPHPAHAVRIAPCM